MSRRHILMLFVLVLTVADVGLLTWHWLHGTGANATITYAGLDSLSVVVPAKEPALMLKQQQWYLDGRPMSDWSEYMRNRGQGGPVALVTLAPRPTYAQFIQSVRDLKKRKICNVAMREGGAVMKSHDEMQIPAFVLCGHQLGDAGFRRTLPPDGPIRVPTDRPMPMAPNGS